MTGNSPGTGSLAIKGACIKTSVRFCMFNKIPNVLTIKKGNKSLPLTTSVTLLDLLLFFGTSPSTRAIPGEAQQRQTLRWRLRLQFLHVGSGERGGERVLPVQRDLPVSLHSPQWTLNKPERLHPVLIRRSNFIPFVRGRSADLFLGGKQTSQ